MEAERINVDYEEYNFINEHIEESTRQILERETFIDVTEEVKNGETVIYQLNNRDKALLTHIIFSAGFGQQLRQMLFDSNTNPEEIIKIKRDLRLCISEMLVAQYILRKNILLATSAMVTDYKEIRSGFCVVCQKIISLKAETNESKQHDLNFLMKTETVGCA